MSLASDRPITTRLSLSKEPKLLRQSAGPRLLTKTGSLRSSENITIFLLHPAKLLPAR